MNSSLRFLLPLGLLLSLMGLVLPGCEPREDIVKHDPGAQLSTSVDTSNRTVRFDTIFTQRGSVTKRFWVYNRKPNAVRVDEIALVGAEVGPSPYSLIINGRPSPALRDFDLRGKDSVLVLVKVLIDPTNADTSFLVSDSVRLRANGGTSYVRLRARGENADYYDARGDSAALVTCDAVWTPRRPIVLLKNTVVDSSCRLTIEPGTRIYVAPGANLIVRGQLLAGRRGAEPVKFLGIRRDYYFPGGGNYYADAPGQWGAVIFVPTLGDYRNDENVLENCDIRNPTIGVQISNPYFRAGHRVRIESSIIRNCYVAGVLGVAAGVGAGGGVSLINTVIHNVGQYAVAGLGGGTFRLAYCTIATNGYSFARREDESLAFNDVVKIGEVFKGGPIRLTVENSIVWSGLRTDQGDLKNEILILHEGQVPDSALVFRNNLLQTTASRYNDAFFNPGGSAATNVLNLDPKFRRSVPFDPQHGLDLRPDSLASPALNLARPLMPAVTDDLLNLLRPNPSDAGAYEWR